MAKIIMLYQDEKLPSSRVRVLNMVSELSHSGLDVVAQPYPRRFVDRLRLFSGLNRYDLVLLQKKLLSRVDFFLLRRCSRNLAFDFDDAIYLRDGQAEQSPSRTRQKRFRNIVKNSDLIIAGNPVLAATARSLNPAVTVVPSSVPCAGIAVKDWQRRNERLVVGWVGGGGNLPHLALAGDALRQLAQEIDLELRVISNKAFHLEGVAVKNIAWSLETQEQEIACFDVGIMPLPKNPWTEGKCSYKLLQYMSAGIPVVATDWGFNKAVVQPGINGFLAQDMNDFYRHIMGIRDNPGLAREMGDRAQRLIEQEYSITAVGNKLGAILSGACAKAFEGHGDNF